MKPVSASADGAWINAPFDLFEFVRVQQQAAGHVGFGRLPRIIAEIAPGAQPAEGGFDWTLTGIRRARSNGQPADFVRLTVVGTLALACQRCLVPFAHPVGLDVLLEVVRSDEEADAAPLDDDEADVIVGATAFDLAALIEDEILLSLPSAPRHDVCPAPTDEAAPVAANGKPSPFAVLAQLKGKKS